MLGKTFKDEKVIKKNNNNNNNNNMEVDNTNIKIKSIINEHQDIMYQTHTWGNEILNDGIRGIGRRDYILESDIQYKTVLDLGCATGAECIWSLELGAKTVIGIDSGEKQINTFKKIINCLSEKYNNKAFAYNHNLKNQLPDVHFEVDTVFCFSITHHINYKKIWLDIPNVKVVYVEGGSDSGYTEESLSDDYFEAKFISFIENNSEDKQSKRPLFRLVKKKKNIIG